MKPGVFAGTMIVEISFLTRPSAVCDSPVTAVTVTSFVMSVPELVMNCFEPLMTHSSPSSLAVVRVPDASEPAPASVRPKPPSASPEASIGSHCSFCSCEPKR